MGSKWRTRNMIGKRARVVPKSQTLWGSFFPQPPRLYGKGVTRSRVRKESLSSDVGDLALRFICKPQPTVDKHDSIDFSLSWAHRIAGGSASFRELGRQVAGVLSRSRMF